MEILIKEFLVLIDEEDLNLVMAKTWHIRKTSSGQVYFQTSRSTLHRLITNCPKGMVVDHINGNTLDNRKCNLRICTKLQNQYNQKKHKGKRHSKHKGVTFRKELKSKPWEAFIYKNYKSTRLGYFATEKEAAQAYNVKASEFYGEFAKLNDIDSN